MPFASGRQSAADHVLHLIEKIQPNAFTASPVRAVDNSYDGVDELTCQYVMHLAADLKIEWDHRRTNVELICLVGHVAITAWAGTYECHPIAIFRNAEHLWREGESG